jgi:hypothetical protein
MERWIQVSGICCELLRPNEWGYPEVALTIQLRVWIARNSSLKILLEYSLYYSSIMISATMATGTEPTRTMYPD